ncbi:hypothetical protein TA05_10745 [Citrobacter rodentium]|nr:hypothetical protein TA05_10745 [Citrobacter rodentium]
MHDFSPVVSGTLVALITAARGFQVIKSGIPARIIFCLLLGCSVALIHTGWQQYGWVPGIFIIFAVMLCLTFWAPEQSEQEATAETLIPAEKERRAWQKQPGFTLRQLDSPYSFFSPAGTRRNGIVAYRLPDIVNYPSANDHDCDAWRFAFIERSLAVLPGGGYVTPVISGDVNTDQIFDWGIYAFRKVTGKHYGLRYKHACVEFPAGWLNSIAVVENTCRGSDWHTLLFCSAGSAVELDFSGTNISPEKLYAFAVLLSDAWGVRLTLRYANHN